VPVDPIDIRMVCMRAGLSEKQLQRGFREMFKAKNDEEKSPYAHYSKLQLW